MVFSKRIIFIYTTLILFPIFLGIIAFTSNQQRTQIENVKQENELFLQENAQKINIYYNTLADGMGEGESSRFIKQILHEMPSKNPNVNIKEKVYKSPCNNKAEVKDLQVIKTDDVYEKIIKKFKKTLDLCHLFVYNENIKVVESG